MEIIAWGVVVAIGAFVVFGFVVAVRDLGGQSLRKEGGAKAKAPAAKPGAPKAAAATQSAPKPAVVTPSVPKPAAVTPSAPKPAAVTPSVPKATAVTPSAPETPTAKERVPAPAPAVAPQNLSGAAAPHHFVGESLVGEGDEVAHIDLVIGSKAGPAGVAFAQALSNQKDGFSTLLAVVAPNVPAKPDTLLFNKVTIKGADQAVQMFGPAQAAVARAVVDSVESGVIPRDRVDDYCVLVGVFIHWDGKDNQKIYDYNYRATKEAIQRALASKPSVDEGITGAKTARHPFASNAEHIS